MPLLYKNAIVQDDKHRNVPVNQISIASPPLTERADGLHETLRALKQQVIDETRCEAARLLEEQRLELQSAMVIKGQRYYEAARHEGYEAGRAMAQVEADKLMQEIWHGYSTLEADRQDFIIACEADIAKLVLAVAEQVLRQELKLSKGTLPTMVAEAVAQLISRRHVAVFVHPERVAELTEILAQASMSIDAQNLLVRPDPTLDRQSFRAEDDLGVIVFNLPEILRQVGMMLL